MKNIKIEYTAKQKELIKEYLKKYKDKNFKTKNKIFDKNFNLKMNPFTKNFEIIILELNISIIVPKETLKLAYYLELTKDNSFIDELTKHNTKFKLLKKLWVYKDIPLVIEKKITKTFDIEKINKKIEENTNKYKQILNKIDEKIIDKHFKKIKGNKSLYALYEELKNKKRLNTKEKEFMQGINNAIKNVQELIKIYSPEDYKQIQNLQKNKEEIYKKIKKIKNSLKNVKTEKTKKDKEEQLKQLEKDLNYFQNELEANKKVLVQRILHKNYKTYNLIYPRFVKKLWKEELYSVGNPDYIYKKIKELHNEIIKLNSNKRKNKKRIEELQKEIERKYKEIEEIEQNNKNKRKKYADKLKDIALKEYQKFLTEIEPSPFKGIKGYKGGYKKGFILNEMNVSYLPEDYDTDYGMKYIEYPSVTFKNDKFDVSIFGRTQYTPKAWEISVKNNFNLILSNLMNGKLKKEFQKTFSSNETIKKLLNEISKLMNIKFSLNNNMKIFIDEISQKLETIREDAQTKLIKQDTQPLNSYEPQI